MSNYSELSVKNMRVTLGAVSTEGSYTEGREDRI